MLLVLCAAGLCAILGLGVVILRFQLTGAREDAQRWEAEAKRALKLKAAAFTENRELRQERALLGNHLKAISHTTKGVDQILAEIRELSDFIVYPLDTGVGEHRKPLPQQFPVQHYSTDPPAEPPAPHDHVEHRYEHPYADSSTVSIAGGTIHYCTDQED